MSDSYANGLEIEFDNDANQTIKLPNGDVIYCDTGDKPKLVRQDGAYIPFGKVSYGEDGISEYQFDGGKTIYKIKTNGQVLLEHPGIEIKVWAPDGATAEFLIDKDAAVTARYAPPPKR